MVNRISATIIADSLNEFGDRLTTFVLVFPRIVLAEFNTHRMISKNSASSRAIPFKTMLKKVQDEPFVPIAWQSEHKGMQGENYITETSRVNNCVNLWLAARDQAIIHASALSTGQYGTSNGGVFNYDISVTKQLCNRLLEPFLYHTVICTGTEWENFFALRAHPQAEIHIADLAHKMLLAYNESRPKSLKEGQWHIPFGDTFDITRLAQLRISMSGSYEEWIDLKELEDLKVQIATARCARVSYLNFEGKDDYLADIKLHDILQSSGHMSPFEHCAQAMNTDLRDSAWSGNFHGFEQYRKMMNGENKQDPRVLHKLQNGELGDLLETI
jgi:thymidylate synthase ThyX